MERLKKRLIEILDSRRMKMSSRLSLSDLSVSNLFHVALIYFRQHWRLKLHQNCILGDLSLRSVGSHFEESGNFEIRESDFSDDIDSDMTLIDKSGVEVSFLD